jgi:hypothetical protein
MSASTRKYNAILQLSYNVTIDSQAVQPEIHGLYTLRAATGYVESGPHDLRLDASGATQYMIRGFTITTGDADPE